MRTRWIWLLVLPTGALAADVDGDGYDDAGADNCPGIANPDQADDNDDSWGDACVPLSASMDPSATMGTESELDEYAQVGAHADLGERVFVGSRVVIAPGADAASGVTVGSDSSIGRRSTLAAGVTVGADSTLGRSVDLAANVTTGVSFNAGYGVTVGANATLHDRVTAGSLVDIAGGATVMDDVILARGVVVGGSATVGAFSVLGPESQVLADGVLGGNVRLRKGVTIGADSNVATGARIGRSVVLENNATVQSGARLGAGVIVRTGAVVSEDERIPRNTIVEASAVGILATGGVRRFADGSVAERCEDYRRPSGSYTFTGPDAVSGLYRINAGGVERTAYCDMTTLGGGWTQIAYHQTTDAISGDARWSALFSDYAAGDMATGSYKLDATGLVAGATGFRYGQPQTQDPSHALRDDWYWDVECDVDAAVRDKWLNPGYANQAPAPTPAATC